MKLRSVVENIQSMYTKKQRFPVTSQYKIPTISETYKDIYIKMKQSVFHKMK